jgi:6-phosphogluconolactonase (cycloisomerase 2 family)
MLLGGCAADDLAPDTLASDEQELARARRASLGVFVMDNVSTRNAIVAYRRGADGSLAPGGTFPTGGLGSGAGLGSQNALILSPDGKSLYAVNAGSAEISVFDVLRDVLVLRDIVPSGGQAPLSLTVSEDLLYVLNAGSEDAAANITGFRIDRGTLTPIPRSARPLSAASVGPAQIEFNPAGDVIVVTEKDTSNLTTYRVRHDGTVSRPIVTPSYGETPFGFSFDEDGVLIVSEAFGGAEGASALSSYRLSERGVPVVISGSVPTEQTAACWIAISRDSQFAYTTNTGSGTISGYSIADDGTIERFGDGGATATPGAGPIDLDFTAGGRLLYVLNAGDASIAALRMRQDGGLQLLFEVAGQSPSSVGIAAR